MTKTKQKHPHNPNKHTRLISSFDRRPGNRPPRRCILIVCEGSKTEPNYFDALCKEFRLTLVEVEIEGSGEAPISVVDHAIASKENRESDVKLRKTTRPLFDEVWCVFDTEDINRNNTLYPAVNKANDYNFNLAISNPCFELWFLLHFKDTSRPFTNAKEVIRELRKFLPNYNHGSDVFGLLVDKTDLAIRRARLIAHSINENPYSNPSTDVFRLVCVLKEIC